MLEYTVEQLAGMIDHTLLKPDATPVQVEKLCEEAKTNGFASVCINPVYVPLAAKLLSHSHTVVCTVIGFPLGATSTIAKVMESRDAIASGASELDMVMNIGAMKVGNFEQVQRDIQAVVEAALDRALVKVIIETCYLTEAEKRQACQLTKAAGAAFVKTSTGFGPVGATTADVQLMRQAVGPELGVKAAGGIRDYQTAVAMIQVGANRIGTSSGLAIIAAAKG